MARRNITKESERTIDEAIIELIFGRYKDAEQKFESVVSDLKDRMEHSYGDRLFHMYFRAAAFGYGLAQGMQEYEEFSDPRCVWEVAEAARNFYDLHRSYKFLDLRDITAFTEYLRRTGKNYAVLGLGKEGLKVLEDSRHSEILHMHLFIN